MQIIKPQAAVIDFKKVLTLEPKNETVRSQMVSTQKLIRRIEFEKVSCPDLNELCAMFDFFCKAIETEEEKNAVEKCLDIIADGVYSL